MKLDLDFKEEKIGALNQELEELSAGGGASEEEVSSLKRQKHDLEMRLKDQVNIFFFQIKEIICLL
jgi:hypothetical protein